MYLYIYIYYIKYVIWVISHCNMISHSYSLNIPWFRHWFPKQLAFLEAGPLVCELSNVRSRSLGLCRFHGSNPMNIHRIHNWKSWLFCGFESVESLSKPASKCDDRVTRRKLLGGFRLLLRKQTWDDMGCTCTLSCRKRAKKVEPPNSQKFRS